MLFCSRKKMRRFAWWWSVRIQKLISQITQLQGVFCWVLFGFFYLQYYFSPKLSPKHMACFNGFFFPEPTDLSNKMLPKNGLRWWAVTHPSAGDACATSYTSCPYCLEKLVSEWKGKSFGRAERCRRNSSPLPGTSYRKCHKCSCDAEANQTNWVFLVLSMPFEPSLTE